LLNALRAWQDLRAKLGNSSEWHNSWEVQLDCEKRPHFAKQTGALSGETLTLNMRGKQWATLYSKLHGRLGKPWKWVRLSQRR